LIQKQINDAEVENKKEVLKTANLTKIDRILIAEKIALGTAKKVEGTIIMPTPSDQLRALDYLGKIYGDYAITKSETEVNINEIIFKVIES
jgi:hypothetical protein